MSIDLASFVETNQRRGLNEADTRHQVIDTVLHEVLAWPKARVSTEEYVAPGFADYVLSKANGDAIVIIGAKKEGVYFTLPHPVDKEELSCYISLSKLLSDENIRTAIQQVRGYCQDVGCEFGGITNGHEWILFKIFEKGKRWDKLQAFVIRSLRFFEAEYTRAYNSLSYNSIIERLSLASLLTSSPPRDRDIFYAKDRIPSYAHSINANRLATTLRPIISHYFGVISDDDAEFMDRCYVSNREYQHTFDGMRTILQDSLSHIFRHSAYSSWKILGRGAVWAAG